MSKEQGSHRQIEEQARWQKSLRIDERSDSGVRWHRGWKVVDWKQCNERGMVVEKVVGSQQSK